MQRVSSISHVLSHSLPYCMLKLDQTRRRLGHGHVFLLLPKARKIMNEWQVVGGIHAAPVNGL